MTVCVRVRVETEKVVDIANYYADLDKTSKDIPPAWKLLYSAKKEYGLRNLSPQSWNKLVDSIVTNEKMAQRFFRNTREYDRVMRAHAYHETFVNQRDFTLT
ncbi:hypothetical protein ANCCEY_01354 [Ancylostoma ceylanicum]|uniref:Uncharacterized protein n=1 Tax=Ancylostoma ceylanicum TaxID=53326 RepID=A0A0D6M5V3_9BILA|nr:hypothetical protein ANCCEY_01354 [Ancylostoma ceylanicum]